jgi:hypothetical protein
MVPLGQFLSETPLAALHELEQKWSQATGFLETYKKAKAARIARVIRLKKRYDSEHPAV